MNIKPFDPHADIQAPTPPSTRGMSVAELYDAIVAKGGSPILILPDIKKGDVFTTPNHHPRVVATILEILARQFRREARQLRKRREGQ